MTPNQIIYFINQSPELLKAWLELSDVLKRKFIRADEQVEESDI